MRRLRALVFLAAFAAIGPAAAQGAAEKAPDVPGYPGVDVFLQYADGNLVFQDQYGVVQRDLPYSTMAGSIRVSGGLAAIIDKLAEGFPAERVRLDTKLTSLTHAGDGIHARVEANGDESQITASAVVRPPTLQAC